VLMVADTIAPLQCSAAVLGCPNPQAHAAWGWLPWRCPNTPRHNTALQLQREVVALSHTHHTCVHTGNLTARAQSLDQQHHVIMCTTTYMREETPLKFLHQAVAHAHLEVCADSDCTCNAPVLQTCLYAWDGPRSGKKHLLVALLVAPLDMPTGSASSSTHHLMRAGTHPRPITTEQQACAALEALLCYQLRDLCRNSPRANHHLAFSYTHPHPSSPTHTHVHPEACPHPMQIVSATSCGTYATVVSVFKVWLPI
jgi:hypothetical protein